MLGLPTMTAETFLRTFPIGLYVSRRGIVHRMQPVTCLYEETACGIKFTVETLLKHPEWKDRWRSGTYLDITCKGCLGPDGEEILRKFNLRGDNG